MPSVACSEFVEKQRNNKTFILVSYNLSIVDTNGTKQLCLEYTGVQISNIEFVKRSPPRYSWSNVKSGH
jgi:hypothetical protein